MAYKYKYGTIDVEPSQVADNEWKLQDGGTPDRYTSRDGESLAEFVQRTKYYFDRTTMSNWPVRIYDEKNPRVTLWEGMKSTGYGYVAVRVGRRFRA